MQGFNMGRYVPPEHEGVTSANKLMGKKALGNRSRKSNQGILTVRFEMPYAIWCTTCPKPTIIGQGVRFNAEKKKVGNYYSTPVFSFRMKHSVCGGWIEMHTDPQNTAYVVKEGAKKRDTGDDKILDGEIRLGATETDRERMENDAFAALEGKVEDKNQAASEKTRIEEIYRARQRDWDDPGEANRRLRTGFRKERKSRELRLGATEALKERMGLGIELLDDSAEDVVRASLTSFGVDEISETARASSRPMFAKAHAKDSIRTPAGVKKLKPLSSADLSKESLRRRLDQNTRTTLDPFVAEKGRSLARTPSMRRKEPSTAPAQDEAEKAQDILGSSLVDYDSD